MLEFRAFGPHLPRLAQGIVTEKPREVGERERAVLVDLADEFTRIVLLDERAVRADPVLLA